MKKKILGIAMVVAIALVAGWNLNQSKSDVMLSDIALSNVEALAGCDITKKDKVVFSCSGEGSCSSNALGYTLSCDGTKQ